jgi:hypothetical protein
MPLLCGIPLLLLTAVSMSAASESLYPSVIAFFLGAVAKLRKATISFVKSVHLSVLMELGSHWTEFHKISF